VIQTIYCIQIPTSTHFWQKAFGDNSAAVGFSSEENEVNEE